MVSNNPEGGGVNRLRLLAGIETEGEGRVDRFFNKIRSGARRTTPLVNKLGIAVQSVSPGNNLKKLSKDLGDVEAAYKRVLGRKYGRTPSGFDFRRPTDSRTVPSLTSSYTPPRIRLPYTSPSRPSELIFPTGRPVTRLPNESPYARTSFRNADLGRVTREQEFADVVRNARGATELQRQQAILAGMNPSWASEYDRQKAEIARIRKRVNAAKKRGMSLEAYETYGAKSDMLHVPRSQKPGGEVQFIAKRYRRQGGPLHLPGQHQPQGLESLFLPGVSLQPQARPDAVSRITPRDMERSLAPGRKMRSDELILLNKKAERAKKIVKDLNKEADKTGKKFRIVERSTEKTAKNTSKAAANTKKTGKNMKQASFFSRLFGDNLRGTDRFFRQFFTFLSPLSAMTGQLSVIATLVGVIGFGMYQISDAFTELERGILKSTALIGIPYGQVTGGVGSVIEASLDTGVSSPRVQDIYYRTVSAGIRDVADSLETVRIISELVAIGLGDEAKVARLVTSAMNAYKESNLTAAEAADVLVATVREGNLEATELAPVMGNLLPIAAALDIQFNELGFAFAAMSRTGTDAARIVTQVRQIMATLLDPTVRAEQSLNRYGQSVEELRHQMAQPGGFLATLLTLKEEIFDVDPREAGIIFGNIRALTGALDLLGQNLETNKYLADVFQGLGGEAHESFKITASGAGFQFNQAANSFKLVLTELGIVFGPVIKMFATLARDTGRDFLRLIQGLSDVMTPLVHTIGNWYKENERVQSGLKNGLIVVLVALGVVAVTTAGALAIVAGLLMGLVGALGAVVNLTKTITALVYEYILAPILRVISLIPGKREYIEEYDRVTRERIAAHREGTEREGPTPLELAERYSNRLQNVEVTNNQQRISVENNYEINATGDTEEVTEAVEEGQARAFDQIPAVQGATG